MCRAHEDKHHARHLGRVAWGSGMLLAFVAGLMVATWNERPEAYCYQDEQPSALTGQD